VSDGISQNTQAILLLTAPLIVGRSSEGGEAPLSAGEYGRLAVELHAMSRQPADLLLPGAEEILAATKAGVEPSRVRRLLARGFQLSQAVERWHARAIWIISRADTAYPRRLKSRLRELAPPVLYGCGHAPLLEAGGLAIVGSRDAEEELLQYTDETARRVASSREAVVSGGARGIDQTAMRAALAEGGNVSGVLPDSLERAALARENREFLIERRLVLVSPFDPSAGFNVGHAMQRNKLVYALADAALVVSSDHNKGGTWTGAVEQLEKLHYVCVYVRFCGNTTEGISALVKKGAVPWPEPRDAQALRAALQAQPSPRKMPPQSGLPFAEDPPKRETGSEPPPLATTVLSEAGRELFAKARDLLLRLLARPMSAEEVSRQLEVNMEQAMQWLERLVEDGALLRATPATYCALVRDEFPATVPHRT
jgi:predicted Rossmann fold nucleotide-binding protein DprA/Smf involved in DNA uptake